MAQITGLRKRLVDAARARHLDLPLGDSGVAVRYRPITTSEFGRVQTRWEKSKAEDKAERIAAEVLAVGFVGLVDVESGELLAEGFTDELTAEFAPGVEQPTAADVVDGIYAGSGGWGLATTIAAVTKWSGAESIDLDEVTQGN